MKVSTTTLGQGTVVLLVIIAAVIVAGGLFLVATKESAPPSSDEGENLEADMLPQGDIDDVNILEDVGVSNEDILGEDALIEGEFVGEINLVEPSVSVVRYTGTGFEPDTIEVSLNTIVTFMNGSGGPMWVASAIHPTHTKLPGFDQLVAAGDGENYSFTFIEQGTWNYHNHVAPKDTGTIIVK